jgi:hypothetical protein
MKSEGFLCVYRPLDITSEIDGLYTFESPDEDWMYELIHDSGSVYCHVMSIPWWTELKLKIVKEADESEDTTRPP